MNITHDEKTANVEAFSRAERLVKLKWLVYKSDRNQYDG